MYSENNYSEADKNPSTESFTCLELFCKFKNQQGGTIHQALKDFESMDLTEKSKFIKILVNNMFHITDIHNIETFRRISESSK